MILWELFAIIAVICLILEMVVPSMFFLNLAIAGILTALLSLLNCDLTTLIIAYVVFSILSIVLLRPILMKNKKTSKEFETGMDSKYIGKTVEATETITKHSGAISIYDERWDARTESDEEIPAGSEVKIIRNDSLVMYVEKATNG